MIVVTSLAAVGFAGGLDMAKQVCLRDQVCGDRVAVFPVGRGLQDRGARETTVGEKHGLFKGGAVCGDPHGQGGASEGFEPLVSEGERDECWPCLNHV